MHLLFLLWLWVVKENCIVAMLQFVIVRTQDKFYLNWSLIGTLLWFSHVLFGILTKCRKWRFWEQKFYGGRIRIMMQNWCRWFIYLFEISKVQVLHPLSAWPTSHGLKPYSHYLQSLTKQNFKNHWKYIIDYFYIFENQ
jgi:hypothetical protein